MTDATSESDAKAAARLRALAAAAGVILSDERAAALVEQAEPHFALLRALDAAADPVTEPAAEFRLDRWTRSNER
jgi:hypothetical protein